MTIGRQKPNIPLLKTLFMSAEQPVEVSLFGARILVHTIMVMFLREVLIAMLVMEVVQKFIRRNYPLVVQPVPNY